MSYKRVLTHFPAFNIILSSVTDKTNASVIYFILTYPSGCNAVFTSTLVKMNRFILSLSDEDQLLVACMQGGSDAGPQCSFTQ